MKLPIERIKKEMSEEYINGSDKLDKLSKTTNPFPKSGIQLSKEIVKKINSTPVEVREQVFFFDPDVVGAYNKKSGEVIVSPRGGEKTVVHELAHATEPKLQEKRIGQLKRLFGKNIYRHADQKPSDYLDSEEEIYARFKAACKDAGIDLSKTYSDKDLDKILLKLSKGKTYRYLLKDESGNRITKTIEVDENGNTTSTDPSLMNYQIVDSTVSQSFDNDREF